MPPAWRQLLPQNGRHSSPLVAERTVGWKQESLILVFPWMMLALV
jgi:hypothetical protein